jgi:hypothetical protein
VSARVFRYGAAVFRRVFAFLALIAVGASPAVTRTRLFCRYTGVEIVACDESRIPAQAQVREAECCVERTFHAIDPTRTLPGDGQLLAAPVAGPTIPTPEGRVAAAAPFVRARVLGDAGPPAFLANRALLI